MLIACWSSKGGSGTTVVASALALSAARRGVSDAGVLLVDLADDVPATLGLREDGGPGFAEWAGAGDGIDVDALSALEIEAAPGLHVLPTGRWSGEVPGTALTTAAERAAIFWAASARLVVVDLGTVGSAAVTRSGVITAVANAASQRVLVVRPCYVALRRAMDHGPVPTAVVVVREPGRSLGISDVEGALGVHVGVTIEFDPAVARAVDAGLVAVRLPRALERPVRSLLTPVAAGS